MQWLILVENQEKAQSIRKHSAKSTVISTKGNPWDVEIELSQQNINYRIKRKEKFRETIQKIERTSEQADKVLLAFDPTNIGEACAREFEQLLGKGKCIRWIPQEITRESVLKTLKKYESLTSYLPKSSRTIANCHWCQAITDIVWTNKVSDYLTRELETSVKMTRLMSALLKSIGDQERKIEALKEKNLKHWEVEISLRKPSGDLEGLDAKVIVPTLSQIDSSGGKITREIWKRKLKESKEASIEGLEIPQPEPGKMWRFSTYEEAVGLKNHIKKFPYFIVETINKSLKPQPILSPLNYPTLLDMVMRNKGAERKEIDECLNWMYYQGLINYPKTTSSNLTGETVLKLNAYGQSQGWEIDRELREFPTNDGNSERAEALRPVSWNIKPQDLQYAEGWRSNKQKDLCTWLYEKIYTRAKESQKIQRINEDQRHFLSGPLFLTRKDASEKDGKKFSLDRENELQAHMTVLLGSSETWNNIPEGYVLESTEVYIRERKIHRNQEVTLFEIMEKLSSENIGRLETLEHLSKLMVEQGLIETKSGRTGTKLTKKGWAVLLELERAMGEYIDLNYHRCLTEIFRRIEEGSKNTDDFLNDWWYNFRTILQSSKSTTSSSLKSERKFMKKSA